MPTSFHALEASTRPTRRPRTFIHSIVAGLALGGALAFAPATRAQTYLTVELLTNRGAESGTLAGWSSFPTGGNSGQPSIDAGAYNGSYTPRSGSWQFFGDTSPPGTGTSSGLIQTVNLATVSNFTTAEVDAGLVTANLSFWAKSISDNRSVVGGDGQSYLAEMNDYSFVVVKFLAAPFSPVSVLGTLTSAHLDASSWNQYQQTYLVPSGTRSISYSMVFAQNTGGPPHIETYIDDNSLSLTKLTAVPEPASTTLLLGLLSAGAAFVLLRRRRAGQPHAPPPRPLIP